MGTMQAAVERVLHVVGPLLTEVTTGGLPEPLERVVWGLIPLTTLVVRYIFSHRLEVLDLLVMPKLQGSGVGNELKFAHEFHELWKDSRLLSFILRD